jgi:hypothetical protein
MLRDKNTGRWHNWGGLTEWLPPSNKGGSLWTDKEAAEKFAKEYTVCDVEVVPIRCQEIIGQSVTNQSWALAADAGWSGVMPNDAATEFGFFKKGEMVCKLTKEEALRLQPDLRLFPI